MKRVVAILTVLLPLALGSCTKGNNEHVSLSASDITLFHNEQHQIEASSNGQITYFSENEFHATVSNTGLVKARHVGETNIKMNNGVSSDNFRVVVKPRYNVYTEPDVQFGESKSSIKAKFGTPLSDTSEGIIYADYSNNAPFLMFLFDNSNRMTEYAVMVNQSQSTALANFLAERYLYIGESDGIFAYVNGLNPNTASMGVGRGLFETYWMVVYTQITTGTRSLSISEQSKFHILFNQIINNK